MRSRKAKKKKVHLSRDLFDCSVALRRIFMSIGDTDLVRTLLRIAVFDLKTERSRIREMGEVALSYIGEEKIYFSRSRSPYRLKPIESMVVFLQPEDQAILQDVKSKLFKLTGNKKFMIDTTVIRFLVFFYGKILLPDNSANST